ncbi:predicted protein [Phaeodactylum tricornutum CCAP 1055/1]|uniref:P-loop containing nucleoside triphosphate hydrolase protein n=1 Tax=Phaeodactylum tricornutum (strain CCAP 1055/1) TaxID=556484 RepID=B5Y4M1_PHATC|nr:predicted protein [Phaeodactylum tricornutum CCAP 1055/1]ACI65506.1 predicted protein [Phaeodactylum tricornutum CCAP 1055/1]|eukprot:XP_002186036.1 predicted protein [Phaeodactylum tricornutum CCAP 1055/1]
MAGFPRSGSHTLAYALESLGFRTCHGQEIGRNVLGTHGALASALQDNDIDAILRETSTLRCNATLELHAIFWQELADASPDTKFIVLLRDFDSWFDSVVAFLNGMAPLYRYPLRFVPFFSRNFDMATGLARYRDGMTYEGAVHYLQNPATEYHTNLLRASHSQFHELILERIAKEPERFLALSLTDGFPPLCDFLQIAWEDCPKVDFPRLGDRTAVRTVGRFLRILEISLYVLPILLLYSAWKMMKRAKTFGKVKIG